MWNRGAHATRKRLSEIQAALPFAITKLDFDNGTEFLNAHFITHFKAQEPKIELSRSRPYRKNDNAHIEQKNYTHVRLLLGDDRFEHYELVEPLNEALREWSLWNNLYGAQRRLLRKERQPDGKVKRYHEKKASTPCARLLAREELSQEQRQKLQAMLSSHDPIAMRASIEAKLRALYSQRAQLQAQQDDDMEAAPRAPHSQRARTGDGGLALRSLSRLRLPRLTALQPAIPRAESHAKTSLANLSKNHQSQAHHGVPHREASSRFLKSSSVSYFNEASRRSSSGQKAASAAYAQKNADRFRSAPFLTL
ncbi:MAG: hypothetical protein IPK22_06485 [Verrucomicrobiaceae bacterium]|nr:hypothetical protein [Verrucomicrobiaceae bacterium]